jgi:hypothetical protein
MVKDKKLGEVAFEVDEHPRPKTTKDDLAKLKPLFKKGGVVTAGNASGCTPYAALSSSCAVMRRAASGHALLPIETTRCALMLSCACSWTSLIACSRIDVGNNTCCSSVVPSIVSRHSAPGRSWSGPAM